MAEWFSIEVFDGPTSARSWVDAFGDALTQAGISEGATNWDWHHHQWGAVLEIEFPDEATFERFRGLLEVRAALDAVPDPVGGLIIYRGRGGSSGSRWPRRPRPRTGSGAEALPIPIEAIMDDLSRDGGQAARPTLSVPA